MDRNRGCIISLLYLAMGACILSGLLGVVIWGIGFRNRLDAQSAQGMGRNPTALPTPANVLRQPAAPEGLPSTAGDPSATTLATPTPLPMPVLFTPTPASPFPSQSASSPNPLPTSTLPASKSDSARPATPGEIPDLSSAVTNSPATRLVIPAMELDRSVILSPIVGETWQVDHLDQQIGHLERTADPGSDSNMVLAAHVTLAPDGRDGPFVNLRSLAPGDAVTVYRGNQPYTYRIEYLKNGQTD